MLNIPTEMMRPPDVTPAGALTAGSPTHSCRSKRSLLTRPPPPAVISRSVSGRTNPPDEDDALDELDETADDDAPLEAAALPEPPAADDDAPTDDATPADEVVPADDETPPDDVLPSDVDPPPDDEAAADELLPADALLELEDGLEEEVVLAADDDDDVAADELEPAGGSSLMHIPPAQNGARPGQSASDSQTFWQVPDSQAHPLAQSEAEEQG